MVLRHVQASVCVVFEMKAWVGSVGWSAGVGSLDVEGGSPANEVGSVD